MVAARIPPRWRKPCAARAMRSRFYPRTESGCLALLLRRLVTGPVRAEAAPAAWDRCAPVDLPDTCPHFRVPTLRMAAPRLPCRRWRVWTLCPRPATQRDVFLLPPPRRARPAPRRQMVVALSRAPLVRVPAPAQLPRRVSDSLLLLLPPLRLWLLLLPLYSGLPILHPRHRPQRLQPAHLPHPGLRFARALRRCRA